MAEVSQSPGDMRRSPVIEQCDPPDRRYKREITEMNNSIMSIFVELTRHITHYKDLIS